MKNLSVQQQIAQQNGEFYRAGKNTLATPATLEDDIAALRRRRPAVD
jgi:hypothetical protein